MDALTETVQLDPRLSDMSMQDRERLGRLIALATEYGAHLLFVYPFAVHYREDCGCSITGIMPRRSWQYLGLYQGLEAYRLISV